MKATVNENCIACGLCVSSCPDVFSMGDDGYAKGGNIPAHLVQDAQQAREAASAGPRSTARLLGLLPVAGLGLSALVGAPPTELLAGPLGWLVVGTGAALAVVGHLWTRALARRAEDGA